MIDRLTAYNQEGIHHEGFHNLVSNGTSYYILPGGFMNGIVQRLA